MEVSFSKTTVPYAAYIITVLNEVQVNFVTVDAQDETTKLSKDSQVLTEGNFAVAEKISTLGKNSTIKKTDQDQKWIDFINNEFKPSIADSNTTKFEMVCAKLNWHLQMRTFFDGYDISYSDLVIYESLKNANRSWTGFKATYGDQAPHLVRWFTFIDTHPTIQTSVKTLLQAKKKSGSTNQQAAKEESKKNTGLEVSEGSFDIDLPDVEIGKVVVRFPPEASGYLHIGHAKAALINDYFAQRYKGTLIMRFDDTNPSKEKLEYEHAILEDLKKLEVFPHKFSYSSDYFDLAMEYAEKLMKEGKAYADKTSKEQLKIEKRNGIESKFRNTTPEESLRLWKEMQNATEEGLQTCIRAKIDMKNPNMTLRDPVLFRCNLQPHNRTGTKYKIYPTYDFICPIVDSHEGVTHTLRTTEYHDRNDQFFWIIDALGIRKPHIWDYSRLNMSNTVMSKRKLLWFVESGKVSGWDDPRFPTVRGLLRHGLCIKALRQFVLAQGASRSITNMSWEKLWTMNKKVLDPIIPRYVAIGQDNVKFHLTNGPDQVQSSMIAKHKKNPELGEKTIKYSNVILLERADADAIKENEEVTLMDWGNAIVKKIEKDSNGKITRLEGVLHLEGSVKNTEKKLTWLADTNDGVEAVISEFDNHLITKAKLEPKVDKVEDFINPNTKTEYKVIGDLNIKNIKKGESFQLERRGYFICDVPYGENTTPQFFMIPDGRAAAKTN